VQNFDPLTLDQVADALRYLDPNDRETWRKAGMAIKAEFADGGYDVWAEWTAQASRNKQKEAHTVWRSFRGRGITIATLVAMATEAGYQFTRQQLSDEERARLRAEADERRARLAAEIEADEQLRRQWWQINAEAGEALGAHLADSGASPYLDSKKVRAYGLRFVTHGLVVLTHLKAKRVDLVHGKEAISAFFDQLNAGQIDRDSVSFQYLKRGAVAVPMQDRAGKLWGYQFINPQGGKKFLKFGRKSGLFHLIEGEGPPALCEGYATGASIHQATGWSVAVAFDAGNLKPVAEALAPDGVRLICADNDATQRCRHCRKWLEVAASQVCPHCGQAHGATNPGIEAANQAARLAGGTPVAVPDFSGCTA